MLSFMLCILRWWVGLWILEKMGDKGEKGKRGKKGRNEIRLNFQNGNQRWPLAGALHLLLCITSGD